ncbi:MAG: valine--tRNA ligase [Alphaproteobacteria bacterium]|nr:valine--tRNA ligase [Alphaproteobacteria bacterium]
MLDKSWRPDEVEAKHYAQWERNGDFAAGADENADSYCIVIPPPNVTGSLHMGHALNNTLQDILIRRKRMQGLNVLWQPGTDHAGIATQMVVERMLEEQGVKRRDLGREKFLEKVWEWKAESGGTITGQLRRLGASCDWSRERFTMDDGLSRAVLKVFVALYKAGLIYKDKRLVNWDPKLHTAISDLEVVQTEIHGHLWHFKYPIEGTDNKYITVATTRPETMLGDTAVAVNPDDPRYKKLIGKHAILPLVGRRLIIVGDEHADPEQGSGAVKITPGHDFNDFEVGRRHDLEVINIFDAEARLNDNVPGKYRGLDRFEARKLVVADLEAEGLVEKIEDHVHMVPYGDRGGVPVEPWLTDQWFADAATLAKPAIAAVEQGRTRFVPENWTKTYYEWMRNIQPWCISRQLWWGHQIPAWYGPDGEVFVEETEEEARAAAKARYGKDAELTRDPDVLDTWFSSALWPFSTLGWPDGTPELKRYYPTDVLLTGFDIIFFWVARMMMMGLHFMEEVPFHTVYIHALVRDAKGQKMSKSKGNVMDPLELVDKYGADALRFTLAALTMPGRDVRMDESRVEGYRNFGTKLWNAARFCEMNQCLPDAGFDPFSADAPLNRWIVGEVARCGCEVDRALGVYRFDEAANAIYAFTWNTFCDWYVELAKPLLNGEDAVVVNETRATAAWVMNRLLRLLHPFMPFITEELWELFGGAGEVNLIKAEWPNFDVGLFDPEAEDEIGWVIGLISGIRSAKSEMNVPAAAKVPMVLIGATEENRGRLEAYGDLISPMARLLELSTAQAGAAPPKGSIQLVHREATVALPVGDVIDIGQEKARQEREIDRLDGDIGKIDRKLGNEQFLSKAPQAVIDEQNERRVDLVARRDAVKTALDRLNEL